MSHLRNLDGVIDEVHVRRNDYAADIVIMLTGEAVGADGHAKCGRSYDRRKAVNPSGPTREEFEAAQAVNAFALVDVSCVIGSSYSQAHEVGHLLGGQHDRYAQPDVDGTYEEEARGFILESPTSREVVRSIMAYRDQCEDAKPPYECPKVLRFSDPDDTSQFGLPLGVEVGFKDAADVQRVIVRNIGWVARYRWWGCRIVDCY